MEVIKHQPVIKSVPCGLIPGSRVITSSSPFVWAAARALEKSCTVDTSNDAAPATRSKENRTHSKATMAPLFRCDIISLLVMSIATNVFALSRATVCKKRAERSRAGMVLVRSRAHGRSVGEYGRRYEAAAEGASS